MILTLDVVHKSNDVCKSKKTKFLHGAYIALFPGLTQLPVPVRFPIFHPASDETCGTGNEARACSVIWSVIDVFPMQILFEVQALSNFAAEEEGDLGFKVREILAVLESRFGRGITS